MAELWTPPGDLTIDSQFPDPFADLEEALRISLLDWDTVMPQEYEGMLIAKPPFYAEGDFGHFGYSDWLWNPQSYVYKRDDDEVDEGEGSTLSELLSELVIAAAVVAIEALISRSVDLGEWVSDTYRRLQKSAMTQFLLGVGGIHSFKEQMVGGLKSFLRKQWGFFQKFVRQIKAGSLTAGNIIRRAKMYFEAVKGRFSAGRAAAHGVRLPAIPGDGSTECLSYCKCSWYLIDIDPDTVHAFWRLGLYVQEHCRDCLRRSGEWNPYIVKRSSVIDDDDISLDDLEGLIFFDEDEDVDEE